MRNSSSTVSASGASKSMSAIVTWRQYFRIKGSMKQPEISVRFFNRGHEVEPERLVRAFKRRKHMLSSDTGKLDQRLHNVDRIQLFHPISRPVSGPLNCQTGVIQLVEAGTPHATLNLGVTFNLNSSKLFGT